MDCAGWCLCKTWHFRRHGFTSVKYLLMMMVLDNNEIYCRREKWQRCDDCVFGASLPPSQSLTHRTKVMEKRRRGGVQRTRITNVAMIHHVFHSVFRSQMSNSEHTVVRKRCNEWICVCASEFERWIKFMPHHPATGLRKLHWKILRRIRERILMVAISVCLYICI